jgi:hypothetical protein
MISLRCEAANKCFFDQTILLGMGGLVGDARRRFQFIRLGSGTCGPCNHCGKLTLAGRNRPAAAEVCNRGATKKTKESARQGSAGVTELRKLTPRGARVKPAADGRTKPSRASSKWVSVCWIGCPLRTWRRWAIPGWRRRPISNAMQRAWRSRLQNMRVAA